MTEHHADLLQLQLRTECLKLGASLFYCSAKEPRTTDTLKVTLLYLYMKSFLFYKDYILNHLYDIESEQLQARGASREALFIPMGWDTEKRISLLTEGPELPTTIVTPRQR